MKRNRPFALFNFLPAEAEKISGGTPGVLRQCFQRFAAQRCNEHGGITDEGWLVAFPTVRLWREIRRICLYHERSRRAFDYGIAHLVRTLEGGDTAKRNQTAEIDHTLGIFPRANKAMKHRARFGVELLIDFQGILKRSMARHVACVDHYIELRGSGGFEMLIEERALTLAEIVIRPSIRRGMIVVESGFTDGANPRISREHGELFDGILRCVMHITWMNADAGMNRRMFGDGEIHRQIRETGCQRDKPTHTGSLNPLNQGLDFGFLETMRSQMAVGIC